MADKTMPDRIRVLQNFSRIQITPLCERVEHDGTYSAVDAQDEQATGIEYVRADLVAGDANESLADGQWRWAKQYDHDEWEVWGVELICKKMRLVWPGAMLSHLPETFYEIGPVIRPPADTAN